MFTSVNYEKYMYMCIPFLVVFCTCHKTVKVSDDDIDQVGVYVWWIVVLRPENSVQVPACW